MQQISTISIGQTVFENSEIAFKRLGLRYKDTGLQRQLKWRYAESIGYPCGLAVYRYVSFLNGISAFVIFFATDQLKFLHGVEFRRAEQISDVGYVI